MIPADPERVIAASRGWLCRYLIISYEIVAPYDVAVVELTADDALRIGREKRAELEAETGFYGSATVGVYSSTPDSFSRAAVADWKEL